MSSGEINKKRLFSTDNQISKLGFESSSARWVKENSVLIALAGQGKTRGTVAINEIPLTTNQSIAAIEPDDKLDSEFLFQNLEKRYEELRLASSGDGSRGGLNKQIISDIKIIAPSVKEQNKVGLFFKHLDETIALHQRKIVHLVKLKQSYLIKMFPQPGLIVSQLRFIKFSESWETRKLGSSVTFLNGRAFKQQELLAGGKYRVLRVGNFNTNDRWYYSNLELENNKYAEKGDLLYLWATNFGPEIWNEERVIYHYHIWKLEIHDVQIDKQYLFTWLKNDKERIKQTTNGTTMVHITKGNIEQREFKFPKNKIEQKKIGIFFNQLDSIINLHQLKVEKILSMKQVLLNKMFI